QQMEDAVGKVASTSALGERITPAMLSRLERSKGLDRGFHVTTVTAADGKPLAHTINKTMMRVDLPTTLPSGSSYTFHVEWWYNINDRMKEGGRSGYEYFPVDSNYLYAIAQFFPRMCVYDDINGWQNKQ